MEPKMGSQNRIPASAPLPSTMYTTGWSQSPKQRYRTGTAAHALGIGETSPSHHREKVITRAKQKKQVAKCPAELIRPATVSPDRGSEDVSIMLGLPSLSNSFVDSRPTTRDASSSPFSRPTTRSTTRTTVVTIPASPKEDLPFMLCDEAADPNAVSIYRLPSDVAVHLTSGTTPGRDSVMKPALLVQLENYYQTESELISQDDERGLIELARQVFTMFIDKFTIYRPILTKVRDMYDKLLLAFQDKLQYIDVLEVDNKMQHSREAEKIMQLHEQHTRDKSNVVQECADWQVKAEKRAEEVYAYKVVLAQREAKIEELEHEIQRLTEKLESLKEGYQEYRGMHDVLNNQLTAQGDEFRKFQDAHKIEITTLQAANTDMATEINSLRDNLDHLQASHAHSQADAEHKINESRARANFLQTSIKQLKKQLGSSTAQCERLQTLLSSQDAWTPRPDFPDMLKEMKTSNVIQLNLNNPHTEDVFKELCQEVKLVHERNLEMEGKLRECLGVMKFLENTDLLTEEPSADATISMVSQSSRLPRWLRLEGQARNFKMPKAQVEDNLDELWEFKHQLDDSKQRISTLGHALHLWLLRKFGLENLCVEYAYNLYDSCLKFAWDPDCEMFLRALIGEVSPEIKFDQDTLLDSLLTLFSELDTHNRGWISRQLVYDGMKFFFTTKSRRDFIMLKHSLARDQPFEDKIFYKALFESDAQGNQSKFISIVRHQHMQDIIRFSTMVFDLINTVNPTSRVMRPLDFKKALQNLDAGMSEGELTYITYVGLGGKPLYRFKTKRAASETDIHKDRQEQAINKILTEITLQNEDTAEAVAKGGPTQWGHSDPRDKARGGGGGAHDDESVTSSVREDTEQERLKQQQLDEKEQKKQATVSKMFDSTFKQVESVIQADEDRYKLTKVAKDKMIAALTFQHVSDFSSFELPNELIDKATFVENLRVLLLVPSSSTALVQKNDDGNELPDLDDIDDTATNDSVEDRQKRLLDDISHVLTSDRLTGKEDGPRYWDLQKRASMSATAVSTKKTLRLEDVKRSITELSTPTRKGDMTSRRGTMTSRTSTPAAAADYDSSPGSPAGGSTSLGKRKKSMARKKSRGTLLQKKDSSVGSTPLSPTSLSSPKSLDSFPRVDSVTVMTPAARPDEPSLFVHSPKKKGVTLMLH